MKKILTLFSLFLLQITFGFSQNKTLKTENVILITLDGFRWQELFGGIDSSLLHNKEFSKHPTQLKEKFWAKTPTERREKLLPFFWNTIAKKGQLYGNRWQANYVNVSNNQWFSYPGYNEILTGFQDEKINSNDKINNPNQTVLEFINQQKGFANKVAAFGSWDVFPYIINAERSKIPVNAGYANAQGNALSITEKFLNELQNQIPKRWESVRYDALTHHFAKEYLKKNQPSVLYISYGETDDFAHEGEYDFYIHSAFQTDAFIKDLWEYVQNDPKYKDKTTFIITTDHGRGDKTSDAWKHHGQKTENSDQIWLAFLGPDTPALGEIKQQGQLYQNQVAKTLAKFLGLNYQNTRSVGEVISQAIK